jgi:hypothetical protein
MKEQDRTTHKGIQLLLVLAGISCCLVTPALAQIPDIHWEHTYGPGFIASVIEVPEGYIFAGSIAGPGSPYPAIGDAWVVRLDYDGNIVWNHTFGGPGDDEAWSVIPDPGGCVFAGHTDSYGSGNGDAWVVKINTSGFEFWNKTYGGAGYDSVSEIITVTEGYLFTGATNSSGAGHDQIWLVKLDTEGNEVWNTTWGDEPLGWGVAVTEVYGGYLVLGITGNDSVESWDARLLMLDHNGAELWNRTYGGDTNDFVMDIIPTNAEAVFCGWSTPDLYSHKDAWVVKVTTGHPGWERRIGGDGSDHAASIIPDGDGFLFAGVTNSYGSGNNDGWVVKIDANGTEAWNLTLGGPYSDGFGSIIPASAGSYILAGTTESGNSGMADAWVVNVSFITPEIALANIQFDLAQLNAPKGIATSLEKKLDSAITFYEKGDIRQALSKLTALQHELRALSGKKFSSSEAEEVIREIEILKGYLSHQ